MGECGRQALSMCKPRLIIICSCTIVYVEVTVTGRSVVREGGTARLHSFADSTNRLTAQRVRTVPEASG